MPRQLTLVEGITSPGGYVVRWPRLKPREFYDLLVQIALICPGRSRVACCIRVSRGGLDHHH